MQVAEEGLLVAVEREHADGYWDAYVYTDHAAVCVACEFTGIVAVLGEDNGAVGKWIGVHHSQALFKVLYTFYAQNRSKDFSVSDGHARFHMVKDCRPNIETTFIAFYYSVAAI